MLKVGVTGGIGSGKSVVCQVFETLGIPVFYADKAARYIMENDALVIESIKALFGNTIYRNGALDREQVSSIVFRQPGKLQELNAIVHPATIQYGQQWMNSQNSPYVVKEAAIFFESGSHKDMDYMIGVFAPAELRIERSVTRDNISREKVQERMANQMDEDEKMKRCNYVITNNGHTAIIPQVLEVHNIILAMVSK